MTLSNGHHLEPPKPIKSSDGNLLFGRLAKVALLVLIIPHSNAEEERVFSLVTSGGSEPGPARANTQVG